MGTPLLEKFLGVWFLVSSFQSLLVSWCLVSWSQSFKVSQIRKNPLMLLKDIGSVLPNFHFVLLEDIDPISNICKNLLDGSSGFVGSHFSNNFKIVDLQNVVISKHIFKT